MADALAEAMEARGFGRSGRTFRKVYRMRVLDWLAIIGGWGGHRRRAPLFCTLIKDKKDDHGMLGRENATAEYDGRRTLVIGDVNTGKTRLTEKVMARWVAQGRSHEIVVLDLAPETQETIGGRIHLPAGFQGVVLATTIVAPRLSGRDEEEADPWPRPTPTPSNPFFRIHAWQTARFLSSTT